MGQPDANAAAISDRIPFGLLLWSQSTTWPAVRDAAVAAEAAGWDSVWTWDHLLSIFGAPDQPMLEGWTTISAVAAVTSRVRVGLMVGANTFRAPGLTAKLATTLDHVSGGRAVLGLGGAWFEPEHVTFDLPFGSGFGERLDRLEEAVPLLRRLLDGEVVTHEGRFYTLRDAICAPRPVQARLPILVGGSGLRKTLRTVARHADAWNTSGTLDEMRLRMTTLLEHCAEAGRDPAAIEKSMSVAIVIRDRPADAESAFDRLLAHSGATRAGTWPLLGSPGSIAAALRPFLELGYGTVIARMPAPYDRETIDRIGEVGDALAGG